jgi:hypothetical protein
MLINDALVAPASLSVMKLAMLRTSRRFAFDEADCCGCCCDC